MSDFMLGRKGLVSSPYEVQAEDFDLEWIATSLGRQCRYLGNGRHFYSVAQHCWELSLQVPHDMAFVALMHDAPEAFVGDVHSYIKNLMRSKGDTSFDDLENHFWGLIATKYDLPEEIPEVVKKMDVAIRTGEMQSLFYDGPYIRAWTPDEASRHFLNRCKQLRPDLQGKEFHV